MFFFYFVFCLYSMQNLTTLMTLQNVMGGSGHMRDVTNSSGGSPILKRTRDAILMHLLSNGL